MVGDDEALRPAGISSAGTVRLGRNTEAIAARSPLDDSALLDELHYLARLAFLLCGDEDRAEDAAAETIARVWRRSTRISIDHLRPYARRTLMNVLTRSRRRFWNERGVFPRVASPSQVTGHGDAVSGWMELRQALQQLPHGQRAVIVLRYFEDLSEAEIAETLHVSAGTVKSRAARALVALRKTLEGADEDNA